MKTILTAAFVQETNRYCPGVSSRQNFIDYTAYNGKEEILRGYKDRRSDFGAMIRYFSGRENYDLIPIIAWIAAPGPVVEQSVWQMVCDTRLEAIKNTPKVDGILLSLHGAMVTENSEDGEGDLLEVLRRQVGDTVPIITSLDLHANITRKMLANADAFFPCEYYPHTDDYDAGLRAADCMRRTLEGQITPVMRCCKLDMVLPYMPHAHPAFAPLLAEAQSLRGKGNLIDVSICHGFFPADIYEQGVAVLAVADKDADLAQKTADVLGEKVFAARRDLRRTFLTPKEGVRQALQSESFPVVLADVADNPGAGASSDGTELLRKMIEMDVQDAVVATIFDPETVAKAEEAGVGNEVEIDLGGKVVPQITGGPIRCKAYVKMLTDGKYRNRDIMNTGRIVNTGKTALLKIGGIYVIVASVRVQCYDLEVYRSVGIRPEDMKILVVKSTIHYRTSFGNVASAMLDVEAPALAPQCPEAMPLAHSRRPIYPLDDI